MARFNLTQAEIVNRRKWVHGSQKQVFVTQGYNASTLLNATTQVSTMLTALAAAKEIAAKRGTSADMGATARLGEAVRQENDEFIASQSDQQSLLMRYAGGQCACNT